MADEKLTGVELDERAAELEIEGRSAMSADEKRAAIATAEDNEAKVAAQPSPPPDEPEDPANTRDPEAEPGDFPRVLGDEATEADLADPNVHVQSVEGTVPAPPGAHPDTDLPAMPAVARHGYEGYPIVPTDAYKVPDDSYALINHFARVDRGEFEGRYGVVLSVTDFGSDGLPESAVLQTRDNKHERLVVDYLDLVRAEPGGR